MTNRSNFCRAALPTTFVFMTAWGVGVFVKSAIWRMTNTTTPKLSTVTKLNKENESAMDTKPPSWHKHVVMCRAVSSDRYILKSLCRPLKVEFVPRVSVDLRVQVRRNRPTFTTPYFYCLRNEIFSNVTNCLRTVVI